MGGPAFRCPRFVVQQSEPAVNKKRPVNLDLTTIQLPLPAFTSILHRVSGFALFAAIALLLYLLQRSLSSAQGFAEIKVLLSGIGAKFIIWAVLCMLVYHLVAGIKHLLMDSGIGESLEGGRLGAQAVLAITLLLAVILGFWLW